MKTSNCQTSPWTRPADRLLRGWLRVAMFVAWCLSISRAVAESPPRQPINYNRDVRPILADNCFRCHGPDEGERQSGLRLDSFEGATAEGDSGLPAIIPGNVEESELLRRIDADEYEVMPPPDSGKTLSEQQKEVLREWIAQGAEFAPHWSFIAPKLPALPELADSSWPRNAIDHFVLQGLRSAGVAPAEEADRRTLIRRVSFDLTGIPPTPQEVEAFLSDESTNAYERLVDRLLASPRFGERMAIDWLDLARYADTDGYEKDSHRQMWPYRDWVIRAFNRNMPFDQFTIEQLAGDMLPNATRDQQIASAFNRNGPTTSESGSDPAEYAVKYAVDRVATTSTVWLGLTMQCAECHDHKFDPLSIRDFYSMVAFFDQVPEIPLYEGADSPPSIPALDPQQEAAVTKLDARLAKLGAKLKLREQSLLGEQLAWESQRREAARGLDAPRTGLIAEYLLDEEVTDIAADSSGRQRHGRLVVNDASSASRPQSIAAVSGRCVEFYGYGGIESGALPEIDLQHGFSYGAWVRPTAQGGVVLSCVDPQSSGRGFDLYLQAGQALVHVVDHWPAAAVKVTSQTNYKPDEWLHVMVVVRGGGGAKDVALYFDGVEQPTTADLDAHPLATVNGAALLRIGSRAN
ncbi:MAG TPA: DUF1549 domain-containing protein, partial [Lacipirellulaceae bacterium]|nr:DUF1549 domain-containing protein [Lacipirellulaceae bacterium]